MPNDIYFQIGLITIIGLSAKNAILVVEFAKEHFERGATLIEAALHAVRQRTIGAAVEIGLVPEDREPAAQCLEIRNHGYDTAALAIRGPCFAFHTK